jgi:hypothetical protein
MSSTPHTPQIRTVPRVDVFDDREHLLKDLADIYAVMVALTAVHGIEWHDVVDQARAQLLGSA